MAVKVYFDRQIECLKCRVLFVWTANDQRFFDRMVSEKVWSESTTPKKCRKCKSYEKHIKAKENQHT